LGIGPCQRDGQSFALPWNWDNEPEHQLSSTCQDARRLDRYEAAP
jgi:hypothetical protein